MDVDQIQPGALFPAVVRKALQETDVLLAVIGEQWLTLTAENGGRRIDQPDDWVAEEIGIALRRGTPIIPVLFDDARMPNRDGLPPALVGLADWQALGIAHESFSADSERLIETIERVVRRPSRSTAYFATTAVLAILGILLAFLGPESPVTEELTWDVESHTTQAGADLPEGTTGLSPTLLGLDLPRNPIPLDVDANTFDIGPQRLFLAGPAIAEFDPSHEPVRLVRSGGSWWSPLLTIPCVVMVLGALFSFAYGESLLRSVRRRRGKCARVSSWGWPAWEPYWAGRSRSPAGSPATFRPSLVCSVSSSA
jgi:hypothetical protein